jgi:phosphoribosylanthranilate isomerase
MSRIRIKFCGLMNPDDAEHAAALGATYGGVILTESTRRVDSDRAREVFDGAPSLKRVGVVGNDAIARILHLADEVELNVLQLHGTFSSEDYSQLRQEFEGELWGVVGIDHTTQRIPEIWKSIADSVDALLLDTSVRGKSGGTGKVFDWNALQEEVASISREIPIVLAGGLNPDNVALAIATLNPAVVDVSSGVESSPGVKSHDRMTAFARAVSSASIV